MRGVRRRRVPGCREPPLHGMRGAAAVWRGAAYVGGHGVGGALVQRVPGQHVPVIVVSSLDELYCAADVRPRSVHVDRFQDGAAHLQ